MTRRVLTDPKARQGRASRVKGANGERELAKKLTEYLGVEASRGCQHAGGVESPDIKVSIPGVHIECKRVERLNIYDAMEQSTRDSGETELPTVCFRKNNEEWIVAVKLKDLKSFVTRLVEAGVVDG